MTETLIQRLRQVTIFYEGSIDGETIKEAANALEASEREIARLQDERDRLIGAKNAMLARATLRNREDRG